MKKTTELASVSFRIPLQRMRDILTTAVESGIAYWATDSSEWSDVDYLRDEDGYVHSITLARVNGSSAPALIRFTVTDLDLVRTFAEAMSIDFGGNPIHPDAFRAAVAELNGDFGDFDAMTADVLVQFAFFGRVVYG